VSGLSSVCLRVPDSRSIVAITGLAGHGFGSWRNRESDSMWLRDFLPNDVQSVRIMAFGYNSTLAGSAAAEQRILDYVRDLIQQLENARSAVGCSNQD
jgi:hypothetical protein